MSYPQSELVLYLRRHSKGFSRGSSNFRGVTRHRGGRWEARIGQLVGKKYRYLGLYDTETQVRAFQAEAREVGDEEVQARVAELQGRLLLARKLSGEALACLRSMKTEGLSINLRISRDLGIG